MKYSTGCIPTPKEIKQNQYVLKSQAPRVIDWEKGFTVENDFLLQQRNQGKAGSCTGQATAYYGEAKAKNGEIYSAKHIYSQVYQPEGGAYIWQAMSIPIKQGYADITSVPDKMTEEEMRDTSLNSKAKIEALALKYAQINHTSIDELAGIIEDYTGFVGGFTGNFQMFETDGTLKIPSSKDFGHAIYLSGYKLKDNKKVLMFKNSWGNGWGSNGYGFITEEFVNSQYFFDAYVYAGLQDIESMYQLYRDPTKVSEIYAISGSTKRHISNLFTLRGGKGDLWDYSQESDIMPYSSLGRWNSLVEKEEVILSPNDNNLI